MATNRTKFLHLLLSSVILQRFLALLSFNPSFELGSDSSNSSCKSDEICSLLVSRAILRKDPAFSMASGELDSDGMQNALELSASTEIGRNHPMFYHIEVELSSTSAKEDAESIKLIVVSSILDACVKVSNWRKIFNLEIKGTLYPIKSVTVGCCSIPDNSVMPILIDLITNSSIHIYHLYNRSPCDGVLQQNFGDECVVGSRQWDLPCEEFDGIWESLIFDDDIKNELLSSVYAVLRLSDLNVNSSLIRINRLFLLHGPPGTGKTSLCKALAQKLSIHLSDRYKSCIFIEVNSHSLFSKWFSESGKLVQKLFEQIEDLAEFSQSFIFVLMDEVESICMARSRILSSNEPTDSMRVVNAILNQIDRIRRHSNVLIFATSNISHDLDEAFIDRTDICRFVGLPSALSIYSILSSCIYEMQRVGIVEKADVIDHFTEISSSSDDCSKKLKLLSKSVADSKTHLSGRALKQIPLMACAKFPSKNFTLEECVEAFEEAIYEKLQSREVAQMK